MLESKYIKAIQVAINKFIGTSTGTKVHKEDGVLTEKLVHDYQSYLKGAGFSGWQLEFPTHVLHLPHEIMQHVEAELKTVEAKVEAVVEKAPDPVVTPEPTPAPAVAPAETVEPTPAPEAKTPDFDVAADLLKQAPAETK